MPEFSVSDLSRRVEGQITGDASRPIRGVAPLDSAEAEDLSFVANARYLGYLASTRAGAVLLPVDAEWAAPANVVAIRVRDPHAALAILLPLLYPEEIEVPAIHVTAIIGAGAQLGSGVSIGPYAVIGRGCRIGDGCRIGAHAVVGDGAVLGAETVLHAHATLYRGVHTGVRCVIHSGARIGADGFGYVWTDGAHRRVPQVGGCRLEDDVEVGANATIDRGSIGDTVVDSGTKIDNLVQVGHNCRIGKHVILISQVGVSGSTVIGDHAVLAGQVGVQGHIRIGSGARVGGQAGVTADVPDGQSVSGYPARPHREAMRAQAALFRLPEFLRKIRRLERAVFGEERGSSELDRSKDTQAGHR